MTCGMQIAFVCPLAHFLDLLQNTFFDLRKLFSSFLADQFIHSGRKLLSDKKISSCGQFLKHYSAHTASLMNSLKNLRFPS